MHVNDPTDVFVDWLIAMDDPRNETGMRARQTVTLTEIIRRARLVKGYRQVAAEDEVCGWRGFAGGGGCVRSKGHDGGHGFADGSGSQDPGR
jgi:hypothetical protein